MDNQRNLFLWASEFIIENSELKRDSRNSLPSELRVGSSFKANVNINSSPYPGERFRVYSLSGRDCLINVKYIGEAEIVSQEDEESHGRGAILRMLDLVG